MRGRFPSGPRRRTSGDGRGPHTARAVSSDQWTHAYPREQEIPFDSARKRMVTIHGIEEPRAEDPSPLYDDSRRDWYAITVKGAPDVMTSIEIMGIVDQDIQNVSLLLQREPVMLAKVIVTEIIEELRVSQGPFVVRNIGAVEERAQCLAECRFRDAVLLDHARGIIDALVAEGELCRASRGGPRGSSAGPEERAGVRGAARGAGLPAPRRAGAVRAEPAVSEYDVAGRQIGDDRSEAVLRDILLVKHQIVEYRHAGDRGGIAGLFMDRHCRRIGPMINFQHASILLDTGWMQRRQDGR